MGRAFFFVVLFSLFFCLGCEMYPTAEPRTEVFLAKDLKYWGEAGLAIPEKLVGTWISEGEYKKWYYLFRQDGIFKITDGKTSGLEGAYRIKENLIYFHIQLDQGKLAVSPRLWCYSFHLKDQELSLTELSLETSASLREESYERVSDLPIKTIVGWTQTRK